MFTITSVVRNIDRVLTLYSTLEFKKYTGTGVPPLTIDLSNYTTISGSDLISSRDGVSDIYLLSRYDQYYLTDPNGLPENWYISRYTDLNKTTFSAWSIPTQGSSGDLLYNPIYPSEIEYTTADKQVIRYIRSLIGDPIRLVRDFGEEYTSYLQADNKVYILDSSGWPCSINMYGTQYNDLSNPIVNGYKFLKFKLPINTTLTIVEGSERSIDIWWYSFRNSDRQIMTAYDECFPPSPLTTINCTPEIYMMQTAYNILMSETWESTNEDGTQVTDDKDSYNPSPGLTLRDKLLTKLRKQLDDAIKSNRLLGIGGVRLD
jgi:hypothetical protein